MSLSPRTKLKQCEAQFAELSNKRNKCVFENQLLKSRIRLLEKEIASLQKFIRSPKTPKSKGLKSPKAAFSLLNKEEIGKTTFGDQVGVNQLLGLMFLLRKFGSACAPLPKNLLKLRTFSQRNYSMIWECKQGYRQITAPPNFTESWKRCMSSKKVRFILVPLILIDENECKKGNPELHTHANFLIYDKKNATLERFEPNGPSVIRKTFFESDRLDKELQEWFNRRPRFLVLNYISPLKTCLKKGFQDQQSQEQLRRTGDPSGFCVAWTLWYANLRLRHPDTSREKLVADAMQAFETPSKIKTNFIRNYAQFIVNEKYKILKNFTKDEIKRITPEIRKAIDLEIVKLIKGVPG